MNRLRREAALLGLGGALALFNPGHANEATTATPNQNAEMIAYLTLAQTARNIGGVVLCMQHRYTQPAEYSSWPEPSVLIGFPAGGYEVDAVMGVNANGKPMAAKTRDVQVFKNATPAFHIKLIAANSSDATRPWLAVERPLDPNPDITQYDPANIDGPLPPDSPAQQIKLAKKAWAITQIAVKHRGFLLPGDNPSC